MFKEPYLFKKQNVVVVQGAHGRHLRSHPGAPAQADGGGGQGDFAQWNVIPSAGNIVQLQSVKTGKFLRIWQAGSAIDIKGGGGPFTRFFYEFTQPGCVRLQSEHSPGAFIAMHPDNRVVVGQGGHLCNLTFLRRPGPAGAAGGLPPSQWKVFHVAEWLKLKPQFAQHADSFRDNAIAGQDLLGVSQDDLKELGVSALGVRKALLRAVEALKMGTDEHAGQIGAKVSNPFEDAFGDDDPFAGLSAAPAAAAPARPPATNPYAPGGGGAAAPPSHPAGPPPAYPGKPKPAAGQSAMAAPVKPAGPTHAQPRGDARPTLVGPSSYNIEQAMEDARELRRAMKGMGCNKKVVIEITGSRNAAQRQMIRQAFVNVDPGKNRDLIKDLKSELGGKLEDLVKAIWRTPEERDAKYLKKAMDGVGFNSDLLIEILCTRTNEELRKASKAWEAMGERRTLVDRVAGETKKLMGGGNFQHLMLTVLKADRPANGPVNQQTARMDAEELNRMLSTAKESQAKAKFIDVFTSRPWTHIAAISQVFQEVSRKWNMEAAIKKAFGDGSDTSKALRVIAEFATEPYDFWAKKLVASMKGMGTDDQALIRIIASRADIDMDNIRQAFGSRWGKGKTLMKWLKDDLSGNYETMALKACGF